ncbi:MAG: hypothetical protein Q4G65_16925 [bacterium]|nr:hypothetical protein [bacterium]
MASNRHDGRLCAWQGLVAASLLVMGFPLSADWLTVRNSDAGIVHVGTGTNTVQEGLVAQDAYMHSFSKTGAGNWVLPLDSIVQHNPFKVDIAEGTLELQSGSGTLPAMDEPTAVLQKAAVWLEASTNVALAANGTDVIAWYDVREAQDAEGAWGSQYCSAYSVLQNVTNALGAVIAQYPVVRQNDDGRTMVYFNGRQSGSSMYFCQPSARGTWSEVENICHVFQVRRFVDSFGYALGNKATPYFHPADTSGGLGNNTYLSVSASHPGATFGRFYRDGEPLDVATTTSKAGLEVFEWEGGPTCKSKVGTFFSDRSLGGGIYKRSGGDDIGEVLIFTNWLSMAERVQVEEYLIQKWKGRLPTPKVTARTAATAALAISEGDYDLRQQDGTVVKKGEGTAAVKTAAALAVNDGTLRVETAEARLKLAPRSQFAVTMNADHSQTIARAADVVEGTASVTGESCLRVEALDAAITNLVVGRGSLTLGARAGEIADYERIEVELPDPGFENFSQNTEYNLAVGTRPGVTFDKGWYAEALPKEKTYEGVVKILNMKTYNPTGWMMGHSIVTPQGDYVITIKDRGAFWTTVRFPKAGYYELSLLTYGRQGCNDTPLDVELIRGEATNLFGRVISVNDGRAFRNHRMRLPRVEAGVDYTLRFSQKLDVDFLIYVDDLHLYSLSKSEGEDCIPVPNGDFEITDFDRGTETGRSMSYNRVNTAHGWTLEYDPVATAQCGQNCSVQPVAEGSAFAGRYNSSNSKDGAVQMQILGQGALLSDAFELPAGTWKLVCDAAYWGATDQGDAWKFKSYYVGNAPELKGSLVRSDSTEISLGSTGAFKDHLFKTFTFGTAFTVEAGEKIRVRIAQTTGFSSSKYAGVNIDNIRCVRVGDGELVVNGGFEDADAPWTFERFTDASQKHREKSSCFRQVWNSSSSNYGSDMVDGLRRVLIVQIGCISQLIKFPEAGTYRLSFWTKGRSDFTTTSTLAYAGNQVRAWLAKDNVTNEFFRTACCFSSNFVQQTVLFKVDEAGEYRLGLQGVNGMLDEAGNIVSTWPEGPTWAANDRNVMVDKVSVRKVDAAATVPAIDSATEITLDDTARLRLDYDGVLPLHRLRLGGHRVSGMVDASHPSGLVSGIGSIYVKPFNTIIIFR